MECGGSTLQRILMLANERESQRDSAIKPRVASSELPWEISGSTPLNLEEVAPPHMINPRRTAHPTRCCACGAMPVVHPESSFSCDVAPVPRCIEKPPADSTG